MLEHHGPSPDDSGCRRTDEWLASLPRRSSGVMAADVLEALDAARDSLDPIE